MAVVVMVWYGGAKGLEFKIDCTVTKLNFQNDSLNYYLISCGPLFFQKENRFTPKNSTCLI